MGDLVDDLVARAGKLGEAPAAVGGLRLIALRHEGGVDVGDVLVWNNLPSAQGTVKRLLE